MAENADPPVFVAWDTETHLFLHGLAAPPPVCVSFAWMGGKAPEPLCGMFTHKSVPGACLAPAADGAEALRKLMRDPHVVLVGHYGAYDALVESNYDNALLPEFFRMYKEGRMPCTSLRQQLIDLAHGNFGRSMNEEPLYSLADLAQRHLKVKLDKGKDTYRYRYSELDGVPLEEWPEEAVIYPLKDAATTLDVFLSQTTKGGKAFRGRNAKTRPGLKPWQVTDEDRQERADWALTLTGAWGMLTDEDAINECIRRAKKEELDLFVKLQRCRFLKIDGSVNLKVVQQRVEQWYKAQGKPIPRTEKGAKKVRGKKASGVEGEGVSYSADTLNMTDDKDLHLLARLMSVRKEMSTFLNPIKHKSQCRWSEEEMAKFPGQVECPGCKVRVTASYRALVANGRCSCRNPNLQQVPKDGPIRSCFVAPDGSVLLSCDYDTLELRTLAQVCLILVGKSALADALREGKDVHCLMASKLTKIPYETLVAWRKAKTPEWEAKGDRARRLAKVANFGLGGGMGAEALKANFHAEMPDMEMTLAECAGIIEGWHEAWPEMALFFKYVANLAEDGSDYGEVVQLFSGRIRSNATYTERCNSFFSGLAGDGAKDALWEVCCESYLENPWGDGPTALFGSRPCGFIHDEILLEAGDDDTLTAVGKRLSEVMCRVMQRWVPDVPITATAAAMRRWSKKADTVYVDENGNLSKDGTGRLIAWEDRPKKAV